MGGWYWIGLAVGVGAGLGVVAAGLLGTVRAGLVFATAAGAAAGAAAGYALGGGWAALGGGAGGLAGALGTVELARGTLRRGGTRAGTAALFLLAGLAVSVLALVPVAGFVEAALLPVLGARLRRRSGERYAGLRILARD